MTMTNDVSGLLLKYHKYHTCTRNLDDNVPPSSDSEGIRSARKDLYLVYVYTYY
jgi:hypothetical protein